MGSDKYECRVCGQKFDRKKPKNTHEEVKHTSRLHDFEELEDVENLQGFEPEEEQDSKTTDNTNEISLKHYERLAASEK